MTLYETRSQIAEITGAVNSYISAISTLEGEISAITGKINSASNSFGGCVESEAISSYNEKMQSMISSSINGCTANIDSAIGTLKNDANRKIIDLVDAYNAHNSQLKPEEREPYLSYGEFNL